MNPCFLELCRWTGVEEYWRNDCWNRTSKYNDKSLPHYLFATNETFRALAVKYRCRDLQPKIETPRCGTARTFTVLTSTKLCYFNHHLLTITHPPHCVYQITYHLPLRPVSVSADTIFREIRQTVNISQHQMAISAEMNVLYEIADFFNFQSLPVTWCTNSLTFYNCTFCPHCIYVFYIYLRTNSDLCHLQHKLIGFYNRDEKCLQRGTDWVFK